MADLTKLDAPALRSFIDGEVASFRKDISAMRAPGKQPPSLYDLSNAPIPLAIGSLASDGDTGGKKVVSNLLKAAGSIDAVLSKHGTAFDDLKRNLEDVITSMLKTQGDSLVDVDGQKFLSAISGYDHDMSGGNSITSPTTSGG